MAKLTDIKIRNLKPGPKRREIPDPGARGLYVVVQPSGQKSYAVRYRFGGRPRKLTLQAGVSLAAARKAAAAALYEVGEGRDPAEAKKVNKAKAAGAAANSLQAICEEYLKREAVKLRTGNQRARILARLVYPPLGKRPVASIKRSEVVRILDQIADAHGERMANSTLAVLRRVFNWFAGRTDDFRSPIVRGMARTKPGEHARERILSDDELRSVWTASAGEGPFPGLVRFLLLTAARRGEAAGMKWNEIDGANWTLPAARHKTKVDLIRPLSRAGQKLLAELPRIDDEFVFTTDGKRPISGFSKFKHDFDKACGVAGWTLHDLRRTARSLMSRAGVNSDHAERCLGHVITGVRGTYDRHEYYAEKQRAFEALAAQVERVVNPKENVVLMRGQTAAVVP